MRRDLCDILACPRDGSPLSLVTETVEEDVREGLLVCLGSSSHRYPIRDAIADFRERESHDADEFATDEEAEFGTVPTKAVARKLSKISAELWLDAGCGRAAYRPFVSGRYVGVDLVRPFLLDAKDRAPDGDFVAADIRHLPFGDRTFDGVVASQVIEHLEISGWEQVLNEFRRVARRSIIVDTPNEAPAISALRHLLYGDMQHQPGSPLAHYSRITPRILEHYGFHVEGCIGHVTRRRFRFSAAWDLFDVVARRFPMIGGNLIGTMELDQGERSPRPA